MNLKRIQAFAPFMKPTGGYAWSRRRRVTVDADARLTKAQAIALLELGQGEYCVLRVGFGPRGGWNDAVIVHTRSQANEAWVASPKRDPHAYFMVRKIESTEPSLFNEIYGRHHRY